MGTNFENSLPIYRLARAHPDWTPKQAATVVGAPEEAVREAVDLLLGAGLLNESPATSSGFVPSAPAAALSRLLAGELDDLDQRRERLTFLQAVVPSIIGELQSGQDQPGGSVHTELIVGAASISAALQDAAAEARTDVLSMYPGPNTPARQLEERRSRVADVIGRGVTVRTIHLTAATRGAALAQQLAQLGELGAEVRTAHTVPLQLVVVDDVLACTPVDTADGGSAALVTRGPALTRVFRRLFEHCWASASPLVQERIDPREGLRPTDQQRSVLQMMAAGLKDEAIAREHGVSVRTLRRSQCALMDKLGADTRFQMGLKAQALGWLD
ncbi:DNA-binding CsgD family transcriptional regulator [Kitasatospora sp. MAA4]|uniref:helix-turn-helix transcriptional regulator n=1 Tax=Kitasatospora sp. MAA4 TaxID=3035093 RepID=UPI002476F23C|nr:helix-turn-helix domain-containing protein [Kitasatospora sp. MAA4]MDH6130746.1 DNA-binding CsgD family transcriptional regulator [Kitasatospora sp. MAA4]